MPAFILIPTLQSDEEDAILKFCEYVIALQNLKIVV